MPPETKGEPDLNGKGDGVVGNEVSGAANVLLADSAKQTVGATSKGVKDLHDGNDGEHAGDDAGDIGVVGEEERQVVAEGAVYSEVEDADEDERDE